MQRMTNEERARRARRRAANRAAREQEAVLNETLAERRERLTVQLEIAESLPFLAPQAVMLRDALSELPPAGGPKDALTWREFSAPR